MRIALLSSLHGPTDTRIVLRQGFSLAKAGSEVRYFLLLKNGQRVPELKSTPKSFSWQSITVNQNRLRITSRAWHYARQITLEAIKFRPDVAILHDPELLLHAPLLRKAGIRVIYDMHEDLPASISTKAYLSFLPSFIRDLMASTLKRWMRGVLKDYDVMLAEDGYAAEWGGENLVGRKTVIIRNYANVEELTPYQITNYSETSDLVYIGSMTIVRGFKEMLDLAHELRVHHHWKGVLHLIGSMDTDCQALLATHLSKIAAPNQSVTVKTYNFTPLPEALKIARTCTLGLSLLHDTANYRHSVPTKILEYMAIGLPVLVSDVQLHANLVGEAGLIYKFDAKAVADLLAEPSRREKMGKAGIQRVTENFNWAIDAKKLIDFVEKD